MTHKFTGLILTLLMITSSIHIVTAQDDKLKVVATTTQASDLVDIIAGDLVDKTALMGAGVDPHLYKPTEANIQAMNEADLVIYSGLHLEGQFTEVFEALGERGVLTHALSDPVKQAGFVLAPTGILAQAGNYTDDPHFWFDPRNWQLVTQDFANLMSEIDPDHADIYQANAEAYLEDLQILFDWGVAAMSQIPEGQRYLVTSHDAFQYFGDAFGMEMIAVQGVSTEDEAGVGDIQQTVDLVVNNQVPVMFVESSISPATIEAVQEAAQDRGWDVQLGIRVLYSDAMGEPGTFGGTYIGMNAENIITILQSFDYPVPEFPTELNLTPPEELFEVADAGD